MPDYISKYNQAAFSPQHCLYCVQDWSHCGQDANRGPGRRCPGTLHHGRLHRHQEPEGRQTTRYAPPTTGPFSSSIRTSRDATFSSWNSVMISKIVKYWNTGLQYILPWCWCTPTSTLIILFLLSAQAAAESKTLIVNNLSYSATEDSLQSAFEGAVSIRVPQNNGRPKGWVGGVPTASP